MKIHLLAVLAFLTAMAPAARAGSDAAGTTARAS